MIQNNCSLRQKLAYFENFLIFLFQDADEKEIGTPSSSQVENRKRPSPQDFLDENRTKVQKKSEKAENENLEETITGEN